MIHGAIQSADAIREQFYGGADPSELPLYSMAAAARTLKLPPSTVQWWVRGRDDRYVPVVKPSSSNHLSFNDLLELFVVKVLRRSSHNVTLKAIRQAVRYAEQQGIARVLLSEELSSFHGELLLEGLKESVAISLGGQVALKGLIEGMTKRIDRQKFRAPVLHPNFDGEEMVSGVYPVSVSPVVAFGRPTLSGYGVRTSTVNARVESGETVAAIAEDYGLPLELVANALVYEHATAR